MTTERDPVQARAYNRSKLVAGLSASAAEVVFLAALVITGWSHAIGAWATAATPCRPSALLLFVIAVAILQGILVLPISFFRGYVLEHRFELSNQNVRAWAWEQAKGVAIAAPLGLGAVLLVYTAIDRFGGLWWLPVSVVLALVGIVLARIAPVVILPIFYRLTPLPDGPLKERISDLCREAGVAFGGIFSFNLSRTTRKANAGLTGIGRSRRIILGDTLLEAFTEDEIETVFAHELGHHVHRHTLIRMATGTASMLVGFWAVSKGYALSLPWFGFTSPIDLGALPLVAIWGSLVGAVTGPIGRALSRHHERQADAYAVTTTRMPAAFISALRKLEATNLADPEPHPLVEFLFYTHPSVGRRVRAVEAA